VEKVVDLLYDRLRNEWFVYFNTDVNQINLYMYELTSKVPLHAYKRIYK
jgi:hypothetical protein